MRAMLDIRLYTVYFILYTLYFVDMPPILKVKNLSVVFDGQAALSGVDFEVVAGESLAIIGPNGSGKTVLFRSLIGSVPHSGEIVWDLQARIGYVPQRIDLERSLPLTLGDFLMAKARISGLSESAAQNALTHVRLPKSFFPKKLGALSGGQLQRALVAFALIGSPNVLLFDEPTSGVDLPREEQIYDMVHRLQEEHGLTLLLISHDLSLVYRYANRVLCLNTHMVCYGGPQEVLTPENLRHLYGERVLYQHVHPSDADSR